MDPHQQWCHNRRCRAYGRLGEGLVVIHSQKERRYRPSWARVERRFVSPLVSSPSEKRAWSISSRTITDGGTFLIVV
jgi:hypothetical protein